MSDIQGGRLFHLFQSTDDLRKPDARIMAILSPTLRSHSLVGHSDFDGVAPTICRAVELKRAIFQEEGAELVFRTLVDLYDEAIRQTETYDLERASLEASRTPSNPKEGPDMVAIWTSMRKEVQEMATHCLRLLTESQDACYTDDVPTDQKLRRRKKDLEAVRWGLRMCPAHTVAIRYPPEANVEMRLDEQIAALADDSLDEDQKRNLLAQSEWFLTPTFSAEARYRVGEGAEPAYTWAPRLTSHLIPGWEGTDLLKLPTLNLPEEVAESDEIHSIAAKTRMDQCLAEIKLTGDFSVIKQHILPCFAAYADRTRAYMEAVESAAFSACADDQVLTRKLRASFGLHCAIHKVDKELNDTLTFFQADCKTLTARFRRRRASVEQKRIRRAMQCQMMYRMCKHGDQVYDIITSMHELVDKMALSLGDRDRGALERKRIALRLEAEKWRTELEKCHVASIQEHLDTYSLAELLEDMHRNASKGIEGSETEGSIHGSREHAPVTLPPHARPGAESLQQNGEGAGLREPAFTFILNTDAAYETDFGPSETLVDARREEASQQDFEDHYRWRTDTSDGR